MGTDRRIDPVLELGYLIFTIAVVIYVAIINSVIPSASVGHWFAEHVPPALAMLNVVVLAALVTSLTLYAARLSLWIRFALLLAFGGLGSFLVVSMRTAPMVAWIIVLGAVLIYGVLWRKQAKEANVGSANR